MNNQDKVLDLENKAVYCKLNSLKEELEKVKEEALKLRDELMNDIDANMSLIFRLHHIIF